MADGVVDYVGPGKDGRSSMTIVIAHQIDDQTVYGWHNHMYPDDLYVQVVDEVEAGEVSSPASAPTADSTGAHLHFEIHTDGELTTTDPLVWLQEQGCSGHQRALIAWQAQARRRACSTNPHDSRHPGWQRHRPRGSASLSGDEADGCREVLSGVALGDGFCAPTGRHSGAAVAATTAQDAGSHAHSSQDPDGDGGHGAEPGSWGQGRA